MLPLKLPLDQMQTKWASELNPLLSNPLSGVVLLQNVVLVAGANTVNHMLGRTMQGWFLTDAQGTATVYRSQPMNDLTITLVASAPITVSIGVF
jgi:hypothetical protein